MHRIAVLGLGAMGSRMAARLAESGHDVTVWNRTPRRVDEIPGGPFTVAESPKSAAAGAEFVISMVRDDDASRFVWLDKHDGALQSMGSEALAIECSTLSVPYVRELAGAFEQRSRTIIDAPLAGSRPQAEAGQLIFLVGGGRHAYQRALQVLEPLASATHLIGENGAGATVKLMVNALFGAQLAVMAELIGFAKQAGINVKNAVEVIGSTPVCSPATKMAADAMVAGSWPPAFPIELVAKDFALLDRSAQNWGAAVPISIAAGDVYSSGVESGIGGDNINGIVQMYGQRPTRFGKRG